jgi:hypothetical protein
MGFDTISSEEAGGCCGALQAEHLFSIPNASQVHRPANLIYRGLGSDILANRA